MDWSTLKKQAAPVVVNVRVELPYGENEKPRSIDVPLGTLSYGEWLAVDAALPEPVVPNTGVNKTKNRDDVTYRAQLAQVMEDRAYRRLVIGLEKGGMVIPGADAAAKAASLKDELDAGVANALLVFLAGAAMQGKASAEAAADTFRG